MENQAFCYLPTRGRRTGHPHTIEIWFVVVVVGASAYLMAGGRRGSPPDAGEVFDAGDRRPPLLGPVGAGGGD